MTYKQRLPRLRYVAVFVLLTAVMGLCFAHLEASAGIRLLALGLVLFVLSIQNRVAVEDGALKQAFGSHGEVTLKTSEITSVKFHWLLVLPRAPLLRPFCFEIKGSPLQNAIFVETWGWGKNKGHVLKNLSELLSRSPAIVDARAKDKL
jgi:hypothetical protein